jgi:isopenicillin-N epimerase
MVRVKPGHDEGESLFLVSLGYIVLHVFVFIMRRVQLHNGPEEHTVTMPSLGRAVRDEWTLDWSWLHVNHGSFGAAPRTVLEAQQDWRRRMESEPSRFMFQVLPAALRASAGRLGALIGADGNDIVFVENATVGCNAVLRSLRLEHDDEVLVLAHGYRAVQNAVRFVTERAGARMVTAGMPFPRPPAEAILAGIGAALSPRTRLAVIDHITSPSALILPLPEIVQLCHAAGVPVLVDGAHGPGQVPLDLRAIGADWYVGNCHKWLCAPKGCGFLWAARERQADLHPVTISHWLGKGFVAEFEWTGTGDRSAFLCVGDAIDFHHRLGGAALMGRNADLARQAVSLLSRELDSEPGAEAAMGGSMGVVRLPIAGPATPERAVELREQLLERRIDAPVQAIDGALWLRISAHAYNELEDYERLAEVVRKL